MTMINKFDYIQINIVTMWRQDNKDNKKYYESMIYNYSVFVLY